MRIESGYPPSIVVVQERLRSISPPALLGYDTEDPRDDGKTAAQWPNWSGASSALICRHMAFTKSAILELHAWMHDCFDAALTHAGTIPAHLLAAEVT